MVRGTWYQVRRNRYLVPGVRYRVPGTRYHVPGTGYSQFQNTSCKTDSRAKQTKPKTLRQGCKHSSLGSCVAGQHKTQLQADADDIWDISTTTATITTTTAGETKAPTKETRISAPSKRTKVEHEWLSQRMHRAKLKHKEGKEETQENQDITVWVDKVNATGAFGPETSLMMRKCKNSLKPRFRLWKGGRAKGVKGRQKAFSYPQIVRIAGLTLPHLVLSKVYKVSRTAIASACYATSYGYLTAQDYLLSLTKRRLQHMRRPTFAVTTQLWDETGERLAAGSLVQAGSLHALFIFC